MHAQRYLAKLVSCVGQEPSYEEAENITQRSENINIIGLISDDHAIRRISKILNMFRLEVNHDAD